MLVSVNICLYNSKPYILETLDSVFAQTYQNFEIIAVDDGSEDGTADFILKNHKDPRLKIHRQQNIGLGASRNRCIELSKGELVAFLDHDDIWEPDKLRRQVEAMRERPKCGLVFSDSYLIDSNGLIIGKMSEKHDFNSLDLSLEGAVKELILKDCYIDIETVMVRRNIFDDIGYFNSQYSYLEDLDMWIRILKSHEICFIPEPLARWRIHPEQFTQKYPKRIYQEKAVFFEEIANDEQLGNEVRRKALADFCRNAYEYSRNCINENRYLDALPAVFNLLRHPWVSFRHIGLPILKNRTNRGC